MKKEYASPVNSAPNPIMHKYIVEAPAPQNGQHLSSGGIRSNGKMVSQFRNPRPYVEPPKPQTKTIYTTQSLPAKPVATTSSLAKDYILDLVWQDFVDPMLHYCMRRIYNRVISFLESPRIPDPKQTSCPVEEIITVETVEIQDNKPQADNIISFPTNSIKNMDRQPSNL